MFLAPALSAAHCILRCTWQKSLSLVLRRLLLLRSPGLGVAERVRLRVEVRWERRCELRVGDGVNWFGVHLHPLAVAGSTT